MKLIIIGAGGHARSVSRCLNERMDFRGFFADPEYESVCPVTGTIADALKLQAHACFVAIGDNDVRCDLCGRFASEGPLLVNIVSPNATVLSEILGANVFVGHNAFVNAGALIGSGAIINSSVVIEHDCTIGPFSSLAPGVVVGGGVTIGRGCEIGLGAMIRDHVTIGDNAVVGMGSVVTKDIPAKAVGFGNPWKSQETK